MAAVRIVRDNAVISSAARLPSASDWLRSSPRGAYTTARTLARGAAVFDLTAHVARLAASAAEMGGGGGGGDGGGLPPAPRDAVDAAALGPRVRAALRLALAPEVRAAHPGDQEYRVTILSTWAAGGASSVAVHAALLPPPPSPPVAALVAGAPRHAAAAKDSAWVRDRVALEAAKAAASADEVLLSAPAPAPPHALHLYEGASSNLAVVDADGALVTAPEGSVLAGTVRRALLAAAARAGVPVRLAPPALADAPTWRGALLLSTSRLALPVDVLIVDASIPRAAGDWRRLAVPSASSPLVAALVEGTRREVEARGEALF